MAYTAQTLQAEVETLFLQGRLKGNDAKGSFFVWEAKATCRGPKQLENLSRYCWRVYEKSASSTGQRVIGRTGDIWTPKLLLKYGLVDQAVVDERERLKKAGKPPRKDLQDTEMKNLWQEGTEGNIQVMDKWSPVVNDAWVLGGIHRQADFELMSAQAPGNLWDAANGFHVVTARELLGLRRFGYQGERQPDGHTLLKCADSSRAQGATLTEYMTMMAEAEVLGASSVTALINEVIPGLNEEIRSFDRSKLKPVKRS